MFHNVIFWSSKHEIPTKVTVYVMLAIEAGNVKFIPHTCFPMSLRLCQNATLLLEAKWVSDAFYFPDMCAAYHNVLQALFAFEEEAVFCVLLLQSLLL